jgi:signal transduction histidine kinase
MEFFRTLYKFERGSLLLGAGGLLVTFLFAVLVIWATHRQLLAEARLREQERLAQLGQMAATVAHEIRNPLSIMKGSAEVLAKKFGESGRELISYIIEEIERLNRLVDNFLRFARRPQLNLASLSLPEFLSELLAPMRQDGVQIEVPENLPPVLADRDALQQILLNLIRNAREACPENCTITVTARSVRRPGRGVQIQVSDTGPGIPPEVLPRVFEPFFSTRATGSGLGLAICKQLTEAMGGTIEIHSEPGRGTTVSVWLPEGKLE